MCGPCRRVQGAATNAGHIHERSALVWSPQIRLPGVGDEFQGAFTSVGLAIAALSFIAAEAERLGRFLALTGIGPESIRDAAREPNFLLGVLDHVASEESLLVAFAEHSGIDPEDVARAREALARGTPQAP